MTAQPSPGDVELARVYLEWCGLWLALCDSAMADCTATPRWRLYRRSRLVREAERCARSAKACVESAKGLLGS